MQVRAMEKIKKHCTLLPYLFLRRAERYCGPPYMQCWGAAGPVAPALPTPLMTLVGRAKGTINIWFGWISSKDGIVLFTKWPVAWPTQKICFYFSWLINHFNCLVKKPTTRRIWQNYVAIVFVNRLKSQFSWWGQPDWNFQPSQPARKLPFNRVSKL